MPRILAAAIFVFLNALLLPAQAQDLPEISPTLKKMLGALPIADIKGEVQGMVKDLKRTGCGGNLTGCYSTKSGPIQLYFFTGENAQQTFLLVLDQKIAMPNLLKDKVQKVLGGSLLTDPMISISTTDYALDVDRMPNDLRQIVRDSYFDVNSLSFSSGVQLAARIDLNGVIKTTMKALGVEATQLTMRAGVVIPIPTDLTAGAGSGAGLADALRHGDTMKKAGADALKPEAYVEFQYAPGAILPLVMPPMNLSDATFFINNSLVFGYKGNAIFKGVNNKKILLQFKTPLTVLGEMDLLDFEFRMATPSDLTLEDAARVMVAMAVPDSRLVKYGGGFIRDIESIKQPLLTVLNPLSAFKLRNPQPHAEYRFGDSTKPFPTADKYFNVGLVGPLADGGPMISFAGNIKVLGQEMGATTLYAGRNGFHSLSRETVSLPLGPLGLVRISAMEAETLVSKDSHMIRLKGNYAGQIVEVTLEDTTLTIDVPPTCLSPFEIRAKVKFDANANLADKFAEQAGANVNPHHVANCVGEDLKKALKWVTTTGSKLGGYAPQAANEALKAIDSAAQQAAQVAAQQAKEAADRAYNQTKDAARIAANSSANSAMKAFNDAGNFVKGFGKKRHKGGDNRFAPSVFDWDYYYDHNPDVVASGMDLAEHWRDHGFAEGRQGSNEFLMSDYRARYSYLHGSDKDVLNHWLGDGIDQGLQGSPSFNVRMLNHRYTDLLQIFGDRYRDLFNWWMDAGGIDSDRNGRP